MPNRLSMDKTQGITQLFASGMSQRQIARALGIDRKSVARELRRSGAKGATDDKAPTGSVPSEAIASKGAKAPTGSEDYPSDGLTRLGSCIVTQDAEGTAMITKKSSSRSHCARFHELIVTKLDSGLDAQRIYQDLVRDHDFPGKYYSVRRYVQKLGQRVSDPVRRIESVPGEELQVDYGMGAKCKDHTGKYRKTYLFRCVLSHSRKGYTEAVTRLTTESFIRSLENAFRAFGGFTKTVVFDNAKSVVKQADWHDPELNPKIIAFCKHYGIAIIPTRPRTPQHKGKVERGVDYAQENAIKAMTFESVALQNSHLANWEKTVADTRIHGTTKKHVGKQFEEIEKPTLGALPLEYFPCYEEGVRKVSRDGHIEVKGGFYSVPPEYLGSEVWVRWNDKTVRILNHRQELIAFHQRTGKGKFHTLKEHVPPTKINSIERGAQYLLHKVKLIGPHSNRWAQGTLAQRGVHGMRALQGLLSLTRKYDSQAIEHACDTALRSGSYTSRTVRKLLEHGGSRQQTMEFMDEHPVIRSTFEYGNFFKKAITQE